MDFSPQKDSHTQLRHLSCGHLSCLHCCYTFRHARFFCPFVADSLTVSYATLPVIPAGLVPSFAIPMTAACSNVLERFLRCLRESDCMKVNYPPHTSIHQPKTKIVRV